MRTINRAVTNPVRFLFKTTGPVATVYARTGAGAESENRLRHRALLSALADGNADAETLRTVEFELENLTEEPGTEALFVADGRLLAAFHLAGAETAEEARYGTVPRVVPVLRWIQQRPAHVLALVDRTGADLISRADGRGTPLLRTVTGTDDEIERNSPGGMAQMRYQHRAEDSWQHNAAQVADAIVDELDRSGATLLLLAGDVRAVQFLQRYLPAQTRQGVRIAHLPGARGETKYRQEHVTRAVRQAAEEETGRLVAAVAEGLGSDGRAVDGMQATVEALALARVQTLLVAQDPGDRRTVWVGPSGVDIAAQRGPQTDAWPWSREVPLVDAVVRSALLGGAEVRILERAGANPPAEGVGALCRFA